MTKETTTKEPKSWARELALALVIGLGVLIYADNKEMVETLVWPVTMVVAGAFLPNKLQQLQSLGLGRR